MKDTSGPAFPVNIEMGPHGSPPEMKDPGMTRRMWLAGMAMQGLVSRPEDQTPDVDCVAETAYALADAMLKYESEEE